ncbi:hypothetical protein FJ872_23285 [Mesorhizobium sp. B2-5-9]|nr:hypothetical protein FJ872_23285 [Mesorhizobium sp. B2-5-9]TPK81836.1 hypothetical protein FJ936_25470 [Mesorhizobium sp. B2-4-13]
MGNNSAMGASRLSKKALSIVVVTMTSLVAGCQGMDTTRTGSVLIAPVAHPLRSKPSVRPVQAGYIVRSLRIEPEVLMTRTIRTTERTYAFAPPPPIAIRTTGPVKVAFSPVDEGELLGGSPYICSPSGFGQRASCHPRYL